MKGWGFFAGLGIALTVAASLVFRTFQNREPRPPRVIVYVERDGSMALNGKRFADPALLQAALVDACGQKPKPMFYLRTDKTNTLEQTGNAMAIAGKAGCIRMDMHDPSYNAPGPR